MDFSIFSFPPRELTDSWRRVEKSPPLPPPPPPSTKVWEQRQEGGRKKKGEKEEETNIRLWLKERGKEGEPDGKQKYNSVRPGCVYVFEIEICTCEVTL